METKYDIDFFLFLERIHLHHHCCRVIHNVILILSIARLTCQILKKTTELLLWFLLLSSLNHKFLKNSSKSFSQALFVLLINDSRFLFPQLNYQLLCFHKAPN